MKKILKFITGRLFIMGLMIILQVAWIVLFLYDVSMRYHFANMLIELSAVVLTLVIITKRSNPSIKLSWVFLILCLPVIGVPVYLLFGRSGLTSRTRQRMDKVNMQMQSLLTEDVKVTAELWTSDPQAALQSQYIWRNSHNPLYDHTATCFYESGEKLFQAMISDIRSARRYIFLEYFIFQRGFMYDTLIAELEKKSAEGVEVRLIYDDLVSTSNMPPRFYKELQKKGIKCAVFNPMRPIISIIMNHRDHRKILIVDGEVGYTGGINIADEYINRIERYGYWKDNGIRIEGAAVWSLTVMFLEMWDYITALDEDPKQFRPRETFVSEIANDGFVQPYGDTPLDTENLGENVYLNMISRATRYVYIYTPYLIPDQETLVALCNAAKSGVDVRIVTPGIPDKKMIFMLTRSHYGPLLESGVRIFEYTPGFLHGKCFVCDDLYATVGSINLDYRSLYLHFECGVWMYRSAAVAQVYADMCRTFAVSREVHVSNCHRKHPLFMKFIYACLRLLAPLL